MTAQKKKAAEAAFLTRTLRCVGRYTTSTATMRSEPGSTMMISSL